MLQFHLSRKQSTEYPMTADVPEDVGYRVGGCRPIAPRPSVFHYGGGRPPVKPPTGAVAYNLSPPTAGGVVGAGGGGIAGSGGAGRAFGLPEKVAMATSNVASAGQSSNLTAAGSFNRPPMDGSGHMSCSTVFGGGVGGGGVGVVHPSNDGRPLDRCGFPASSACVGGGGSGKPNAALDYICETCRKPAMFVCSACKNTAYCSNACQVCL